MQHTNDPEGVAAGVRSINADADWTWGCIALKNADVDEIYPYIIANKTVLEIVP